jgi:hypothetical protein
MKKLVAITAAMAVLIGAALGQEYKSRLPTPTEQNRIAGVTSYIQDELLRSKTPRYFDATNISQFYYATNWYDGVIVARSTPVTNWTTFVFLPNPTNNINRRFEIIAIGAVNPVLTNTSGFGIVNANTGTSASNLAVNSNKIAVVYSTGTNWIGYIR